MTAFLVGLALLVALAAALLHPYGRKLLGVMALIVIIGIGALWVLFSMQENARQQQQRDANVSAQR
jgi:hypothetical protein